MNWFERFLLQILDHGEIPEHIAVVMDGNRRYARKKGYSSVVEGHAEGAERLKHLIEWLSNLHGVKMLTVYAFSLLNFQRSEDEVRGLMDLAVKIFEEIATRSDLFKSRNGAVRFIGRRELLEKRVLEQIERVEACASPNPDVVLNICVCYTAHDEIERARDACITENVPLTGEEVFQRLELPSRPSLLIRTSGVHRMSNFLLLQCAETPIAIVDKLWPELTPFDVAKVIARYQVRKALANPI